MIEINGIDGGGQILRSALSLSMVTGQPFQMINIRGRRKQAGLKRQHLTCVESAVKICNGDAEGAELGAEQLVFRPNKVAAGDYDFSVGSAGSTTLVLQTLLPALMMAEEKSEVTVSGGTHNPLAPSSDYLKEVFLPTVKQLGVEADVHCDKVGFAPAGGGVLSCEVYPSTLKGYQLLERGDLLRKEIKVMCLNVPGSVMNREVKTVLDKLGWTDAEVVLDQMDGINGAGNCISIHLESQYARDRFTEYGRMGRSAEKVAQTVVKEVNRYLSSPAAVGEYLSDQLVLPMALAGEGAFTVKRVSNHLKTNLKVIRQILDIDFSIEKMDEYFCVRVKK